ncbi:alkane 1-monooxygenase [Defluviimonas sp. WL0050]|uniref:Alkane 1-monooxygenase n=1 Tax=Albidovulum litorale TaxID=2984134 RepID=A0ABT2ZJU6_9RHOB|nr:alkane 1-monooxygenase [Defluviimonas sp. WL0050]
MVLNPLSRLTRRRTGDNPKRPDMDDQSGADDAAIASVLSALSEDTAPATSQERKIEPERPEPAPAGPDADARPRPAVASSETWQDRLQTAWAPWRHLRPFLLATLAPVPLLILAAVLGGVWSLPALLSMTLVLHVADEVARERGATGPEPQTVAAADRLSVLLAVVHFLLLLIGLWALSGGSGLGLFDGIATFLAFGLWFGQVSNSNAHELIHRSDRRLFGLGMAVYISLLFGHHTSAHRLVHHRFVATPDDPNTAAEGESFYAFAARAWPVAFVAGYEMEKNRREKARLTGLAGLNPYSIYLGGAALALVAVLWLFGFDGLLAYLLLCAHAQVQLLLSDYVQHYGLLRRELPSGGLEPAGPGHSWDAPHAFSGMMMLNAPRHADHHAHPARPYPELGLNPVTETPRLPHSLPVMATIALIPPVWHRLMDRRLAAMRRRADA